MLMTAAVHAPLPTKQYWLRGPKFDLLFIGVPLALSLACCAIVFFATPSLILVSQFNVLLLATPHFVATYTRICFDKQSAKKHFFLLVPLPLLIIAGVAGLVHTVDVWIIASVYLYWQWWHFARQNYGVSRMYLAQARNVYTPHPILDNYALYALPLCCILYRSYQQPNKYIGMDIRTFPIPFSLVCIVGAAAAVLMLMQVVHWRRAYYEGRLPAPYLLYVAAHYFIFFISYLLVENISAGWLVFNLWHNLQYIVFVWLYNNNRYRSGEFASNKILTDMSKDTTSWAYFIVLVVFAMALNLSINIAGEKVTTLYALLPWAMIISMSVTFHHYMVDAVIWKRKRRTVYA